MGKVAEKLMGVAPSASAVSRLNQTLTEQFEALKPGESAHFSATIVFCTWMASILRFGMAPKRTRA